MSPFSLLAAEMNWKDRGHYYQTLQNLARMYVENFNIYLVRGYHL